MTLPIKAKRSGTDAIGFQEFVPGDLVLVAQGGTGLDDTFVAGDIIYATAPGTLSRRGIGAAGTVLRSDGLAPAWSTLVKGDLPSALAYEDEANIFTAVQEFQRTLATSYGYLSRVTADVNARHGVRVDGMHEWGPGTGAFDTNLYRSAADTLKTDDALVVGGTLAVTGTSTLTGNVGIGAAPGTAKLDVLATANTISTFRNSNGQIQLQSDATKNFLYSVNSGNTGYRDFAIQTGSAPAVTVQATTGDVILAGATAVIRSDTADTADNKRIIVASGGAALAGRGAYINLHGNEYATDPGVLFLVPGTGANIRAAGALVADSTLTVTGRASFTDHIQKNVDTGGLIIFGGAGAGANIELYGGSHATLPSQAFFDATSHHFRRQDGTVEWGRFTAGVLAWGTTVTTGAAAGTIVLANNKGLRAVNAAGTSTLEIARLTTVDGVNVGEGAGQLNLAPSATVNDPVYIRVGGVNSKQITAGSVDSGGVGYKVLRVPN